MNFERWPIFNPEELKNPEEGKSEGKNFIDKSREKIQKTVNESRMPTENYESTVGFYGGKLKEDDEGRMVFDMTKFISWGDRKGDAIVRTFDEHCIIKQD